MAYTQQQAPASLDTEGVRRFTEEQLREIARATAQMESDHSALAATVATNTATIAANYLFLPVGQCKFVYVDATHCALMPFNGNQIKIAGLLYSIPATGVSVTNAGLAASTLYYAYVLQTAGVLSLEFSATAHATDTTAGNTGVEIKTGDPTRTLVGMVYTNASSQFADHELNRRVRSWFNDAGVRMYAQSTSAFSPAAGVWTEDTSMRVVGVFWKNEQIDTTGWATSTNNAIGNVSYAVSYQNGNTVLGYYAFFYCPIANYYFSIPVSTSLEVTSDQAMTLSLAGQVSAGIGTWSLRSLTVKSLRK